MGWSAHPRRCAGPILAFGNLETSAFEARLTRRVERLGIATFSLSAVLEKASNLEAHYGGHFNDAGHALAGQILAGWIQNMVN
jgi:hypothetical protein